MENTIKQTITIYTWPCSIANYNKLPEGLSQKGGMFTKQWPGRKKNTSPTPIQDLVQALGVPQLLATKRSATGKKKTTTLQRSYYRGSPRLGGFGDLLRI